MVALGGGRPAGSRAVQEPRTFGRDGDATVLAMAGDCSNTDGEERRRSPLRLKEAARA